MKIEISDSLLTLAMPFCHGDQTQFVNALFALGLGTKLLRPENTELKQLGKLSSINYVRNGVEYTHDFGNPYPLLEHCGNQLYIVHDRNKFIVNEAGIVEAKDMTTWQSQIQLGMTEI